jgi:hypothetical protein
MAKGTLERFLANPDKVIFVECNSEKARAATRTALFHARRSYAPHIQDLIGITNYGEDGVYFVKVYRRDKQKLYTMEDGKLVPLEEEESSQERVLTKEILRIKELMEKDKRPQEEIDEMLRSFGQQ